MKESEFIDKLKGAALLSPDVFKRAVELAKEAGARFEPEMRSLPELFNYRGMVGVNDPVRHLTTEDTDEILRRCKAVEEAVGYICDNDWAVNPVLIRLRAILEGTK